MKNRWKRMTAMLLALCMVLSLVPVTVLGVEWEVSPQWTVVNRDEDLTINSASSVTIQTRIGDLAKGYDEPANYWLMDAPTGNFTLTMKVSGGLYAHAQKVGIMAFHNKTTVASVARRYHSSGGSFKKAGNYFGMFQNLNGTWGESFYVDENINDAAWLKLERSGNTFSGWYSYDGETWVSVGSLTNATVGESTDMKIGFYAINGSKNDSASVTVENFTVNGRAVAFAVDPEAPTQDVLVTGDGWTVHNEDGNCSLVSETAITMPTGAGDFAKNKVEPSNYWLMDAPDGDFEITAKVTGKLSVASQTVGIMAFHDKITISAVCRRFHTGYSYTGTSNVFSTFQHYNGSWFENGVADPNPDDTAWLKLVKTGNVFSGFYSYDGETWLSAGNDLTNETVGGSSQLRIGVYATRGSGKTAANVTIEEFTVNGELYPFGKIVQVAVEPESITLDQTALGLLEGDSAVVHATVEPAIAQGMLKWNSSDENVATVEDGVITAVGQGSAVITASAGDISREISVNVVDGVAQLLSQTDWESIAVGYGDPGVNACVSGHDYTVVLPDGTAGTFTTCVAAHAASEIVYDVSELGALYFTSYIALHNQNDGRGNAGFDVKVKLADGTEQVLYTVASMTETTPAKYINVAIPENAQQLILVGDIGTDGRNSCDHTIWGDARLILDPAVQENLSKVSLQMPSYLPAGGVGQADVTATLVNGQDADLSQAQIRFESSDDEILLVDDTGKLTVKGNGNATVTVTVTLGDITKTASAMILVGDDETSIWSVASPDETLRTVVMLDEEGSARYMVLKNGVAVAEQALLGIVTDKGDFTGGLSFVSRSEVKQVSDSYDLIGAKVSHVEATGNELTVNFEKDGVDFAVVVRMYNDGTALRYEIGGEGTLSVSSEYTAVQIPADADVYAMSYAKDNQSQEKLYDPDQLTGTYSEPMLYEAGEGTWVLISEAGLTGNYCGTYLRGNGGGNVRFHFSKEQSGDVTASLPFASPWRMLVIGSAADIANNTLAETLSPAVEGDFSWVEPGVTAWTWLNGDSTRDYNTYASYVESCAQLGWEYLLLDDGWQPNPGEYYDWFDDLSALAKEKGVKLLVWAESWDLADAETRRAVFAEWVEMGISGAKIDHFLSSSQTTIQTQQAMLKDAAEFNLVVNFHGSAKPAGERRTWPNLLTSEGVYGSECSVSNLCAFNNCMIPFTRGAVGTVDYTPLFSHNRKNLNFSLAQMAAITVVYESGIPCLADKPATYQNSPAAMFFQNLPASWDESIMLEADPGELVVAARRSGEDWYVGGMCNSAHTQELSFDFLGEGEYYAVVCTDGDTIKSIKAENMVVTSETVLTIPMLATGGFAIRIMKDDPSADEVVLDQEELTLESYTNVTLTATVMKDGEAVEGVINWESSDESVATVSGGVVLGREPGTALITASTVGFGGKTVTAQCTVTVAEGTYVPAEGWTVVNRDGDLTINSETSISINTRIGDLATGYIDPANYWLMDAPEGDFELTVLVSGGLNAHAQKIGLMAFHDNITIASVARRWHKSGGGNRFGMFQRYNTTWGETFYEDIDVNAQAWLKLQRSGNTFSGWYSYDGENWVSVGTLTNDLVGQSDRMQIGVYAINGSTNDSVVATIENFTLNGELVPFASLTDKGQQEADLTALEEAVKAAQAAAEAAEAAQAAAEAAAASSASDKTAADAAAQAADAAKAAAAAAAEAADAAADAAADYAAGAGEEALKAAQAAAKAAADAADAASALATAASAAEKAQAAQAAAEKAQADAEAAADAADKAAQSAAEDKTAANAAAAAAQAAQSAAEAAKSAAEKSMTAAEKSLAAAAESNKTAAAQAAASASSAKAAASSAAAAAAAAGKTAEAAANAQAAAEQAEDAAEDTTIEKEEAEKALAEALKAKEEALAMAAATGLALEKYAATLELEDLLDERLSNATAEQAEALAEAAEAAAEAIDAAGSVDDLAEVLADAQAALDEILESRCAAEEFTDVDLDAWYHPAVDFVLNQGMMNGNTNGTFTPEESLTRAMLVQILYNIEGRPEVETDKAFTDVAEGDWWYDAVLWAAENGIVLGNPDGTYAPEAPVTREQMVTILYRYAGSPAVEEAELTFDDAADVDDWAVTAVAWAVENGVVKGIGNNLFNPDGNSTRAETAQVMFNYFTK